MISSLDDLQFEREKNKYLHNEVDQLKGRIEKSKTANQNVLQLKKQLEECKEIAGVLIKQLQGKNEIIKKLETEIVSARSKTHNNNKQQDSRKILEYIINSQISHSEKNGLGFDSNTTDKFVETKSRSYIDALRDPSTQENHPQKNESKNAWRLLASRRTIVDSGYRHKERGDRND